MRGSISKRGDGYQVVVDLGPDPLTAKRRRRAKTFPTLAEAENALPDLLAEARARAPAPKHLTVSDLLDRWLAHIEADRSPNTMRGYRQKVNLHLKPALGDLPLARLTPDRIDRLWRAMRAKKLAAGSVRQTHACLSGACSLALRWGWLRENPCDRAKPPASARRDTEAPSLADVAKAWKECGADLRDAVVIAIATGARAGELCGLRWSDLQGSVISFRRSIAHDGSVLETHRKSRLRAVAVDDTCREVWKARRSRAAKDALAVGLALPDSGYVLSEVPGQKTPLNPERITGRWRDACTRAEVKVRFHDLRHLSVTTLLAAGVSPANVAKRHGHSPDVMLKTYAHALEHVDEQSAQIMGQVVAQIRDPGLPTARARPRRGT